MAPDSTQSEGMAAVEEYKFEKLVAPQAGTGKYIIKYKSVMFFAVLHLCGLYGIYLCFTRAKWATILFNLVLHWAQNVGVTAGTHRYWSHRSYKAKLPFQIILIVLHTLACQLALSDWARDHRFHHKYSDTDADPHNSKRGFFFSHIGWLMVMKHPEIMKRAGTIDCSDLYEHPLLRFQKKHYFLLTVLITFLIPSMVPIYFWGESLITAFSITSLRIVVGYHVTFFVNSLAHKYGNKPYDKNMSPTQSILLSIATLGECFHNYHHAFPFDYRTAELGNNYLNMTTLFIDFFAWVGWVYDRKTATEDTIHKRMKRTGDGTDLWGRRIGDFKSDDVSEEYSYNYGWGDSENVDKSKAKVF